MISQKITDLFVGSSGIGASMLVENATMPNVTEGSNLVSAIVQIAIGIITIIGLLKKKRV